MALSSDKIRPVLLPPGGLRTVKIKLAGYTNFASGSTAFTVYKGAVMMQDVTDTDGYARPMNVNAASGDYFMGIAVEHQEVTSSDTADGSVEVTVAANGVWGFPLGGLAQTDVGVLVYASDDDTVTSTSTNALPIGILQAVDSTYAWVEIDKYFLKTF